MVYKITNVLHAIGAGVENPHLIRVVANPLFPLIAISLLFMIILAAITYKSKIGWKLFSVAAILTLSSVAAILFLNKYMAKKINPHGSFSGGTTSNVRLPDTSFFSSTINTPVPIPTSQPQTDLPIASFDDLFNM